MKGAEFFLGKFIDLTNQTFGYWTVLKRSDLKKSDGVYWHCRCKCGTEKIVAGGSLRSGKSTSCGCYAAEKAKQINYQDLSGQKFDKLTVIKDSGERDKGGSVIWLCKCDCGNSVTRTTTVLNSNHTHSCGCYEKEKLAQLNYTNLIGKKFGKLLVVEEMPERTSYGMVLWKCLCDCGNEKIVRTNSLTSGNTSSCGCINYSIGEHNIEKVLKENNIQFKTQYTNQELQLKKYDFAIIEENSPIRFIEFDGQQHYNNISGIWNSPESLTDIQYRDKLKNEYALSHNIPLVRIPYWERDNITLEMIMGDQYLVTKNN